MVILEIHIIVKTNIYIYYKQIYILINLSNGKYSGCSNWGYARIALIIARDGDGDRE